MSSPMEPTAMEPTATPEVETIAGYRVHPAANLLPAPTPEEYKRLRDDIAEQGLRVPITVTLGDNGQVLILDGRSRARACKELGFDIPQLPTTFVNRDALQRYFGRSVGLDDCFRLATIDEERDLVAAVLSLNAARRHLKPEQVAALYLQVNAAKIEADKQAAKAAQQAGLKKGTARERTGAPTGKTAAKIAQAVGVSTRTVEKMQELQRKAPERMADVAAGKVSAGEVLAQSGKKKTAKGEAPATRVGKKSKLRRTIENALAQNNKEYPQAPETTAIITALETLASTITAPGANLWSMAAQAVPVTPVVKALHHFQWQGSAIGISPEGHRTIEAVIRWLIVLHDEIAPLAVDCDGNCGEPLALHVEGAPAVPEVAGEVVDAELHAAEGHADAQ